MLRGGRVCLLGHLLLVIVGFAALNEAATAAEMVDSGWNVSRPPTLEREIHPRQEAQRVEVEHLLPKDIQLVLPQPAGGDTPRRETTWRPTRDGTLDVDVEALFDIETLLPETTADAESTPRATAQNEPPSNRIAPSEIVSPDSNSIKFRGPGLHRPQQSTADTTTEAPTPPPLTIAPTPRVASREPGAFAPVDDVPLKTVEDAKANGEKKADTPNDAPRATPPARPIKLPAEKPATDPPGASEDRSRETTRRGSTSRPTPSPAQTTPAPVVVEPAAQPLPPLSRNQRYLRTKVRRVLKMYYQRPLNSRDHDPWEVMHGMLAYGVHSRIRDGGPRGTPVTAVGWLCYNRPCGRHNLLYVNKEGDLRAKWGVHLQGHYGQFLAMLAQCKVARNYPIRVDGREFTVADLVAAEQETCYPDEELTFKLISLNFYCSSSETWANDQGVVWSIPKLIAEELKQPIRGAPCGGTHRLSGLSLAVKTRIARGEPVDGQYARAAEFVDKYENYAFRLQNRDGSLSTEWFRGRGDEEDIDRRIKTTGHILEWLLYSLDDQEIRQGRTTAAAGYLASLMYSNYNHEWEVGPLSHAIHALALYDERMFQPYDELEEQQQATNHNRNRQNANRQMSRSGRR